MATHPLRAPHLGRRDRRDARPREHPLYPVLLGVVAYGRFVRGELDEDAVAAGEQAVAEAERLGSLTAGLAERALGNALFYLHHEETRAGWTDGGGGQGDRGAGIVAHAYYMRSVAQTSIGDPAGGAEFAALSTAAAIESGSPTALAGRLPRAISLAGTDPARRLALFDRSVEHADAVGNRWIRAFALTESLWIRARQGDPADALVGYRDVIDTWFRGSDWANQWLSLRYVFAILESLGRDEAAAMLYGALEAAGRDAGAAARAVERRRVRPRGEAAVGAARSGRRSPTRWNRAARCATRSSCAPCSRDRRAQELGVATGERGRA